MFAFCFLFVSLTPLYCLSLSLLSSPSPSSLSSLPPLPPSVLPPVTGERVLASGSVQLPRFTLLESGSLLISPSHLSDAGTYTCMASNSRGIDEASADLLVWGNRRHSLLTQSSLLTFFPPRLLGKRHPGVDGGVIWLCRPMGDSVIFKFRWP